jgi:hypothetical protein
MGATAKLSGDVFCLEICIDSRLTAPEVKGHVPKSGLFCIVCCSSIKDIPILCETIVNVASWTNPRDQGHNFT